MSPISVYVGVFVKFCSSRSVPKRFSPLGDEDGDEDEDDDGEEQSSRRGKNRQPPAKKTRSSLPSPVKFA